jgi:hypothetical protein
VVNCIGRGSSVGRERHEDTALFGVASMAHARTVRQPDDDRDEEKKASRGSGGRRSIAGHVGTRVDCRV